MSPSIRTSLVLSAMAVALSAAPASARQHRNAKHVGTPQRPVQAPIHPGGGVHPGGMTNGPSAHEQAIYHQMMQEQMESDRRRQVKAARAQGRTSQAAMPTAQVEKTPLPNGKQAGQLGTVTPQGGIQAKTGPTPSTGPGTTNVPKGNHAHPLGTTPSSAGMVVGPGGVGEVRPHVQTAAPDPASVKTLEQILASLHRADHDYGGYRVRAMHNVHRAIHHLGGSVPAIGDPLGSGNLPQTRSDAILKEAHAKLKRVEAHLSKPNAPQHHTEARHEVARAIRELHVALEIN